jgi:DHA1 family inner membrane transport protein
MIATRYGWRVTYGIVGVIALSAGLVIWLRLPKGITGPRLPLRERLAVIGYRGMPVALLMSFLYMVGAFMPAIYVAAISHDAMGMERAWLPLVLFANGVGAFVGGIVGGQVTDRVGPYRSYVANATVAAIAFGLMSVLPLLPPPLHAPLWIVLMFLAGLLGWALFAGQVALFAILAPKAVPLAVSLNLSAVSVGAAIAALIGGLVIDAFNAGAIGVAASVCALLGLGLAFANRTTLSGHR